MVNTGIRLIPFYLSRLSWIYSIMGQYLINRTFWTRLVTGKYNIVALLIGMYSYVAKGRSQRHVLSLAGRELASSWKIFPLLFRGVNARKAFWACWWAGFNYCFLSFLPVLLQGVVTSWLVCWFPDWVVWVWALLLYTGLYCVLGQDALLSQSFLHPGVLKWVMANSMLG